MHVDVISLSNSRNIAPLFTRNFLTAYVFCIPCNRVCVLRFVQSWQAPRDGAAGCAGPAECRGRRALELGLSPARRTADTADTHADGADANRSWPAPAHAAEMMPWDTPPMRRPKPDQSLLKGERPSQREVQPSGCVRDGRRVC